MTEAGGVLVMAYGTPKGPEEVEAYYTDIRGGKPPPAEQLDELKSRYAAIGGRSPLLEITTAQARGIEERVGVRAYLGQKHAAPFISDAVANMAADGIGTAVGLVLAPHFSTMSVADYEGRARAAAERVGWKGSLAVIPSWHLEPGYISWLGARVVEALDSLPRPSRGPATVVFSAHSLPERILEQGDPYPEQLAATAAAVAAQVGLERWTVGWQSAGRTGQRWLGPDILEVMSKLSADGAKGVVVCPCGFVADHLEVLYDLDIEANAVASELGLAFARTRAPNSDPEFLDVVAAVVARQLRSA
ncbi:MAG TPA: ferrochelatase [Actinomycetota bacterium]|nr:ferrochelatase [Actinomycetota bacterium]